MEITADDIIIFDGHIAMISEVIISDPKEALCRISDSRTHRKAYGGPQSNALWVKQQQGEMEHSGS